MLGNVIGSPSAKEAHEVKALTKRVSLLERK